MAGNFAKPVTTDLYTDILTLIRENQTELAKMLDGSTATNIPSGAKRWNETLKRFEKYDGSTWTALVPDATTSASGLLSAADKTKIDALKTGSSTDKQTSVTDATAGRLLINAAFGLAGASAPTALSAAGALDSIAQTSVYCVSAANVTTVGAPSGANGGVIFTIRYSSTFAAQHYFNVLGGVRSWSRQCNNGTWSAWVENLHTGNIAPTHIPEDATHRWATDAEKVNWNAAKTHADSSHAPSNAQKNSDITKAEIEAKLTGTISSHSHAETGLPLTGGTLTGALAIQHISPQINFVDTDWGTRFIHCNGGLIGFLNSGGSWTFYSNNDGSCYSAGKLVVGSATLQTDGNLYMPWAGTYLSSALVSKASTDVQTQGIGSYALIYLAQNSTNLEDNWVYSGGNLRLLRLRVGNSGTDLFYYSGGTPVGSWRVLIGQSASTGFFPVAFAQRIA